MKKKTDEEMDSDLMDELLDAMSGRDVEALHAQPAAPAGHIIEIHIKPGAAPVIEKETEDDESAEDRMLPDPDELDAIMKKGKR